jgi:hypothetical protein
MFVASHVALWALSGIPVYLSTVGIDHRPERVLDRLLGDVDVAEGPDEHRDGTAIFLAEYTFDLRAFYLRQPSQAFGSSSKGRTSTGP